MPKNVSITVPPWCPFCGQDVDRPAEPEKRKMSEFLLGSCQCGSVYACDQTGHNIGAAMVDCLVHACNDNWDLAWDLMPDDDYLTNRVENYDLLTHRVVDTRNLDGRAVGGVLYFVRLNRDMAEITDTLKQEDGQVEMGPLRSTVPVEPLRDPKRTKKKVNKKEVKELANNGNIDELVNLLFDDSKVIRYLQRLLYDPDSAKRWFYAHILGEVSARYSTRNPGAISDLLHRLFEACTDSASTHWGLIETIGSIIAARPDIFGSFARHLLMHRNVAAVRAEVIWAMAAIAKTNPEIIRATPIYSLFNFIDHPDPATRGHALLLFGRIKATELKSKIMAMAEENESTIITIYEEGKPYQISIGELAKNALALITEKNQE